MRPAFIFVHGFGCDRDSWRFQVDALSPNFAAVALDLPGHGRSPLPTVHGLASLSGLRCRNRAHRWQRHGPRSCPAPAEDVARRRALAGTTKLVFLRQWTTFENLAPDCQGPGDD